MECKLDNIKVNYEVYGTGRPILMLHGWTLDHRDMARTLEPLFRHRDGWKRLYLDLPGHGRTPGEEWIADQDKILEVVLDFIDHVIPSERFAVAGTSAGAYLAQGVAYHRAAWMDGLLLTVPMIVADDAKRTLPEKVVLVKNPELVTELEMDEAEIIQLAVVQSRKVLAALKSNLAMEEESGDPEFRNRIREQPEKYGFSFSLEALPERFDAPTLIVAGRQDFVVGYRDAWNNFENYPRGTFAVLDRAGHILEVEQQELYRALVHEWLNRVEEYAGVS